MKLILFGKVRTKATPQSLGMCRSSRLCTGPTRLSQLIACLFQYRTHDILLTRGPALTIDFNKGVRTKAPWSWDDLLPELLGSMAEPPRCPPEMPLCPTLEEVTSRRVDIPGHSMGYNIGDLLNCPAFHLKGWVNHNSLMNQEIARSLPGSIFSIYHGLNGCIPAEVNGDSFRRAVRLYKQSVTDPVVRDALALSSREDTLVVHIRLGDKGASVNQLMRRHLVDLGPSFASIVVCAGMYVGLHTDPNSISHMYEESKTCIQDVIASHPHAAFFTEGSPDDHLVVMSAASHLMVSTGGFTQLAALACEGKIYKTDALQVTPDSWVAQLSTLSQLEDLTGEGVLIEHGCGTCRRKLLRDKVELLNGYHRNFQSQPAKQSTANVLVTMHASYLRGDDRWMEVKHKNFEVIEWKCE